MQTKESPRKAGVKQAGFHFMRDAPPAQRAARINALGAKERRLLVLLIERPGGFTRREAEPIVGTTYLPNLVKELRDRFGVGIECEIVKGIDRDGSPCHFGKYHAGPEAIARARELLGA